MRFSGKVFAVTGGGSGLGEAVVYRLASEGARVAVLDMNEAAATRVAAQAAGSKAFAADVSKSDDMMRVMQAVVDHFGKLDGAVNNAGIGGPFVPTADVALDWWDRIIGVNLSGVFYSLRAEIPHLIKNGGGSIVNMSSMAGLRSEKGLAAYVASKHGVEGLTKTVALEYGRQGIRCNTVCPTYVRTALTAAELKDEKLWAEFDSHHATGHCPSPEDVAGMVAFLLSADARSVTGSHHLVDGGISAH